METGIITYNVNNRGRQHVGQNRAFNVERLMRVINGPATQELVRHRDMLGFYGHWPRQRFGMRPLEGGIAEGKAHAVEPALVTTFLQCNPNGDIEHKCEFLDTKPGQIAAKLWAQKVGGWSSAIDSEQDPQNFFGFDYVLNPNFSTNRGYALDSVASGGESADGAILDALAVAEYHDATMALLDSLQANYSASLKIISAQAEENEQLLSLLSAKRPAPAVVLDGLGDGPLLVSTGPARQMLRDVEQFKTADLPRFVVPKDTERSESVQAVERLASRMLGGW